MCFLENFFFLPTKGGDHKYGRKPYRPKVEGKSLSRVVGMEFWGPQKPFKYNPVLNLLPHKMHTSLFLHTISKLQDLLAVPPQILSLKKINKTAKDT